MWFYLTFNMRACIKPTSDPGLHVADLLLQCQWSLCWPAPRGDPLQTQEKTGLMVLIRWPLNHLWAVFYKRLIIIHFK